MHFWRKTKLDGLTIMKFAIMGTGGLGGYFGAKLVKAGNDVTFIARGETLQVIREKGLQVYSPDGDFKTDPVQATANPADVGIVDVVLLCVKSYQLDTAIELIKPMIGDETMIIPVLNGITHIAQLQSAFGDKHILGGVGILSAHKGEPGIIHHRGGNYLLFGEWQESISPRCEQVQQIMQHAGVNGTAVDDIAKRMWEKLVLICGMGIFAVVRADKGKAWIPEVKALYRQVVEEGIAVAKAQQIPLADTLPDDFVARIEQFPPTLKPSLLVDLENNRTLEVEVMHGHISKLGKQLNVDTLANDFVYACLKPHINGSD